MRDNKENIEAGTKLCFTQMSARKGIKIFGNKAVTAITEEYEQLDKLNVFEPLQHENMTKEQKCNALNAIDLIKEKRCGKIKGRTVADGRKQRDLYSKAEVSSPTLSLEGFLSTLVVDAAEERHKAIADVAGAFLKADMKDDVIVKLQGPAVDALLKVNKNKYQNYIVKQEKTKVLYVKLLKAMYGTMQAPLLWYTMFVNALKEEGFKINPYNNYVANKNINGNQFTICWYVDDIKFSHKSKQVVQDIIYQV